MDQALVNNSIEMSNFADWQIDKAINLNLCITENDNPNDPITFPAAMVKGTVKNLIELIENLGYNPLVGTRAIQFIFRILSKNRVTLNFFKHMIIVCLKLATQLEYQRSEFESMRYVAAKFKMDRSYLIKVEKEIILRFKGDFLRDTVFNHLSYENKKLINDDIDFRSKYYSYISNPEIYLNSSEYNSIEFSKNLEWIII